MTEPIPLRVAQTGAEAQNPQEVASLCRTASKDISLFSLVPKLGGNYNAAPLAEFVEAIKGTAKIGNWTEADQIKICALRLTDTARDFYRAIPELRDSTIT
jgi:hypothetical protein